MESGKYKEDTQVLESDKYKEKEDTQVLESFRYKEYTQVKEINKFKEETQVEGRLFFIIDLRTTRSVILLTTFLGFIINPIYNVGMAGVLQPLSGKVKIMMNRSIVDGSPRLLFEYQAILSNSYFHLTYSTKMMLSKFSFFYERFQIILEMSLKIHLWEVRT